MVVLHFKCELAEFYKKYSNDTVKLVKLKIHRDKRLELKTIFIKD